ncbi:hypothetical protein PybrP1_003960 [[Pythium] brassicae (nom. inval.)]|nr:hypothetical protein PybrP1_003960 [[Pythium] brassicae (nom. inval.)]
MGFAHGSRHLLRLPANTTSAVLYAPTSAGGLGLISLKRFELDELYWHGEECDDELVELYLNGALADSPHAIAKRRNGDIGSLWSDAQRHMRTLSLRLETRMTAAVGDEPTSENALQLRVPHHRHWLDERMVQRHVRLHVKLRHCHALGGDDRPRLHGGRAWRSREQRRRVRANATCRAPGCTRVEPLAHVLQHCAPGADVVTKRHDNVLAQIGVAVRRAAVKLRIPREVRVNELVPGYSAAALCPDIQLYEHATRTAVIADLAVPLEEQSDDHTSVSTLQSAREAKIAKYAPIKAHLERAGWRVHLGAIVYGALGSVAAGNYELYTEHSDLLHRDARRLDLSASTTCIAASRHLWNGHCSHHRARQLAGISAATAAPHIAAR